jgi:hypothetical protein
VMAQFAGDEALENILVPEMKGESFTWDRRIDNKVGLSLLQEEHKGVPARDNRPRPLEEPKFCIV